MNSFKLIFFLLLATLLGCKKTKNEPPTPIAWFDATEPLSHYRTLNKTRPIIALFTMDWDLVGKMFQIHIDETPRVEFGEELPLFLRHDCGSAESIGRKELSNADKVSLPILAVNYGNGWEWSGNANDYLENPNDGSDYRKELERLLTAAQTKASK